MKGENNMIKNLKKITSAIIISSLCISSIIGCGNNLASDSGGETIKIGHLSDISGEMATTGSKNATELAVEEINENGGVLGKKVELISIDTQSDTKRYQEMAKKLVMQDEVKAVFTNGSSASREAIRPIMEQNKTVYFYNSIYEGGVASKYVFTTGAIPEQQILPMLKYAKENNLGKKVFLVSPDYNYGQICSEWVKKYSKDLGIEVAGAEYIPLGVSQFSSTISKIQSSGADLVFTLLVGGSHYSFFEQFGTANISNVTIISSNLFANYEHLRFPSPTLDNAYSVSNYYEELDTDESKEFVKKIKEKYPNEQYVTSEMETAYNAVYLWKEAVEKAGTADCDKVVEALESGDISFDSPGGHITMDGQTHQTNANIYVIKCDTDHKLQKIQELEGQEPIYLKELGVDLRKESPNKQFSPLEEK